MDSWRAEYSAARSGVLSVASMEQCLVGRKAALTDARWVGQTGALTAGYSAARSAVYWAAMTEVMWVATMEAC